MFRVKPLSLIGAALFVLGILSLGSDDIEIGVVLIFVGASLLLHSNWRIFSANLGKAGRAVAAHSKEVRAENYCSIYTENGKCANMAYFVLVVTIDKMKGPHDPQAGNGIRCCKEHHPIVCESQERGTHAHETENMLHTRNLSVERIHMIERLYG